MVDGKKHAFFFVGKPF